MPTLRITIKMDNTAFHEDGASNGDEAARILTRLADNLCGMEWHPTDMQKLLDINGNIVGEAKVTR